MKSEEDPDLYMKEAATMMREGQSAIPSPERAETEYSLPKSKLEDHKREENKKYLQQLQNPFEERGYKSKELAESPQPKINNTPLAKPFQPKSYQLLSITPVTISFEKIETALCDVMKAGVKADSFDLEEVKKNIAKCASQLHLKKQKDKLVFAKEEGVEMFCKYVLLHYSIPEKEELWKKLVKDSEVGKKNVGNASQI
jgi:hypothetical protein